MMKTIYKLCTVLFLLTTVAKAQTTVRYYKDEAITKETTESKAKFIGTTTTDGDVVTTAVTYPSGTLRYKESYRGDEPVGIWTLASGEQLDYTFPLHYQSQIIKEEAPKAEPSKVAEDTTQSHNDSSKQFIESLPLYEGGEPEMIKFIANNVRYPRIAIEKNLTGAVYISFIIEKDGSVSDVYCVKKIHPLLDKEAIRIIRMLQFKEPGYQNGKPVRVTMNIPVRFSLR